MYPTGCTISKKYFYWFMRVNRLIMWKETRNNIYLYEGVLHGLINILEEY